MAETARKSITSSLLIAVVLLASCGKPQDRGVITGPRVPDEVVTDKLARQQAVAPLAGADSQILFGDLHVHTTFSPDAFIMSVPLMGGSGLHPPADACDFARYCSNLDFWSINDHAEGITPRRWAETKESIRECNRVAGAAANPDTVAFLGWEWSQVNTDPAKHYGHKNVIFIDTEEGKVPVRAIAAPRAQLAKAPMGRGAQLMMSLMDFENREFYWGIQQYYDEVAATPVCAKGVDTRELPPDCREIADDPRELFAKLDQWGFDSIVIPHGNAWGMNTPATTSFDKQLNQAQHDPDRQILFEVYSGHGNSEEYRSWRGAAIDESGGLYCPEPGDGYLPCCWRAGEIIRERCEAAGIDGPECERRAFEARRNFVDAGNSGHLTIPGQQVSDWLNCGTCPDCFNEPMDHRPAATAQYALALTGFEQPDKTLNFRFGLIGASDNHRSKAGTGYKEVKRKLMTEAFGAANAHMAERSPGDKREPLPYSVPLDAGGVGLVNLRNMERQNSFWLTGGLVAAHSSGRNREAIWDSLKRREVYATSGDRILLWFDLLQGKREMAMGSTVSSAENPRFRASALGAFRQQPGCPDHAVRALGEERLQRLCGGECYNPSDERNRIDRIEVVRIRPQFPQFPNIFTMRGEKIRKPIEYIASLERLMALEPEIIVPGHLDPTVGAAQIRAGMRRTRDAVQYVHDATVAGMNAGKSVYELMREIKLPPHLDLVQNHGRVDWAVKSIWEYYAGWFHFDSTTELYPVPARDVYADLGEVAGSEGLLSLANNYLDRDQPVKTLHVVEVALAGDPANQAALALRQQALQVLLERAETGLKNDYEIYWLQSRLADTAARLDGG